MKTIILYIIILLSILPILNSCMMSRKMYRPENFFKERESLDIAEAIYYDNPEQLRTYLKRPHIDIDKPGKRGATFLIYSIIIRRRDMMKILLEHGANPNLEPCVIPYREEITEKSIGLCKQPLEIICENFERYNKKYIELLLKYGADINGKRCINCTSEDPPFVRAVMSTWDSPELLDFLLKHGADINVQDWDGDTALIKASGLSQWDTVEWLLDKGADYKITNNNNISVVHNIEDALREGGTRPENRWKVEALKSRLEKEGVIFPKGPFFPVPKGGLPDIEYRK